MGFDIQNAVKCHSLNITYFHLLGVWFEWFRHVGYVGRPTALRKELVYYIAKKKKREEKKKRADFLNLI